MKSTLLILVAILSLSKASFGQNMYNQIDSIAKSTLLENADLGIIIGFISNDVEYYTAYGKLGKDSQININKNSIFEIASITKIITANLIAQAALENKLQLSDYIDDYLPSEFVLHGNLQNKITISDLASHQSGLPDIDFRKLIEQDSQQPISKVTEQSLAAIINNCHALIDHGQYRYSTMGYTLLGQILETVYGKSYDEIIQEKIIAPLQMTNTLTKDFAVSNKTNAYNPDGGTQELLKWNVTASAGLVKSSASDMITYLQELLNENSAISQAAIMTEQIFYQDDNRELGLGTNIMLDGENTIYLKSGDSMGQSSIICYNRVKKWGIVILLNHRDSGMRQNLLNEIYESVLK
ncbi:MAG: serine hydrolase domain-containing protein [Bacteroidia bacterium]